MPDRFEFAWVFPVARLMATYSMSPFAAVTGFSKTPHWPLWVAMKFHRSATIPSMLAGQSIAWSW